MLVSSELGVVVKHGRPVVSSRDVARVFGKRHDNVLRDIEKLDCSEEFHLLNFEEVKYRDAKGELRPEYLMTRDGFTFLVMGYTGKKAAAFKEAYIRRFNEMEQQLKAREIGKLARRTLTDAIRESGMNDQMRGFAYKTVTDLAYRHVLGMTAAQYRRAHGLPRGANIRDHLDAHQLRRLDKAERLLQALIEAGADYETAKAVLIQMVPRLELVSAQ
ncbi:MAG: Rha family transcriptional regulator [Kyrpidia sp.]|nr:Rha family transcriptional regulator [Kyrpidia sp.]